MKAQLTNATGANPIGDISFQARNSPTDTAFTEVARASGNDVTLYARNLKVQSSTGGAVSTLQEIFIADKNGQPFNWKLDGIASLSSGDYLELADKSGTLLLGQIVH